MCFLSTSVVLFVFHSYDEESGSMDEGYPHSIETDFPGIGDKVDAAVNHYGTVQSLCNTY